MIITSSSDDKLARARELGADHTINYKSNDDWGDEAFDWSGGVDHRYDRMVSIIEVIWWSRTQS